MHLNIFDIIIANSLMCKLLNRLKIIYSVRRVKGHFKFSASNLNKVSVFEKIMSITYKYKSKDTSHIKLDIKFFFNFFL